MKLSTATIVSFLLPVIVVLHDTVMAFSMVGRPGRCRSGSSVFVSTSQEASVDDRQPQQQQHSLSIEYCTGCRWMLKSFWLAQELLTTFENDLKAVTIIPSSTKGIFAVKLDGNELLWDRKEQGGFPSPKGLKQIVRDMVRPDKFLGHSDTDDRQSLQEAKGLGPLSDSAGASSNITVPVDATLAGGNRPEPAVAIYYCTGCRWLLRSAYFGQELLTTFGDEIKSVTLIPSKPPAKGGRFSIELNGQEIFDRATEGRFPEVKEIKQMIRDRITPEKDLGHSDVIVRETNDVQDVLISEDEAALQRRLFGVE